MASVVVIGAGVGGLTAAWRLAGAGHSVTVYESEPVPGGLASSFRWRDVEPDRHFHFVCAGDQPYVDLVRGLGLANRLRWEPTSMGYFRDGRLHSFGSPLSLLRFRPLAFADRMRFGLSVLRSQEGARPDLDGVRAREWVAAEQGESVYDVIWRPLLEAKFGERADDVSAAWLRERVRRLATSRAGVLAAERLGYVSGGTRTLVERLTAALAERGGLLRTRAPVDSIEVRDGCVSGVRVLGASVDADAVISTVATPLFLDLLRRAPSLPVSPLDTVEYLGVVTWAVLAVRPLTRHFWLNVSDPRVPFPGVVTYTRLDAAAAAGAHLHYVPVYMSPEDERWDTSEEEGRARLLDGLDILSPGFSEGVLRVVRSRERWAQPVFDVGFGARMGAALSAPTPVANLYRADMSQTYPHDRSLVNAVAKGLEAADAAISSLRGGT